jgi:methionyl-tRNA formyltransferase
MFKSKIIIITMGLSRIVEPIVDKYNVIGIIECVPREVQEKNNNLLYTSLKYLYFLFKSKAQILKKYCQNRNLSYYYMNNGSDINIENWVKYKNPDIIIVYSMSQLLKKNIFTIPRYGTINLHPSLLPKYRGANPWFWHYYFMEKKGGVTVHYIDNGEDTGDIIYQEEYDILLGMKSPSMQDLAIGKIGVNLLSKALDNIEKLPKQKQSNISPTQKARNIKDNEHQTIIDWDKWNIERIWHILRGTELWLNAIEQPKGIYKGQRWCIQEFKRCNTSQYEISKIYKEKHSYFVVSKDGKIFLKLKFNIKKFILNLIR